MSFNGNIGHLENIQSPWGNAGGVVKSIEDVERMAQTGVGWIEAGSYTLEPRSQKYWDTEPGLEMREPYIHFPDSGTSVNNLGMPNKGMDEVEKEIPEMVKIAHEKDKQLIINVAPVSDEPDKEVAELVFKAYYAGADAVLLNAGCPNVLREDGKSYETLSEKTDELEIVLNALKSIVYKHKPIFIRLAPYESFLSMGSAWQAINTDWNKGSVSAIFTPNTWKISDIEASYINPDYLFKNTFGMSGPAVAQDAADQTRWACQWFNKLNSFGVDVVSSAGIMNAKELNRRLKLGAVAGCGTTFYYESEDWKTDTDRLLTELSVIGEV